jgi:hypothetical protein
VGQDCQRISIRDHRARRASNATSDHRHEIYCRVSTIDESNEIQSEELRRVEAYADQISGIKDVGPGLDEQILSFLAEGEGVSIGTGTQKILSAA